MRAISQIEAANRGSRMRGTDRRRELRPKFKVAIRPQRGTGNPRPRRPGAGSLRDQLSPAENKSNRLQYLAGAQERGKTDKRDQ